MPADQRDRLGRKRQPSQNSGLRRDGVPRRPGEPDPEVVRVRASSAEAMEWITSLSPLERGEILEREYEKRVNATP